MVLTERQWCVCVCALFTEPAAAGTAASWENTVALSRSNLFLLVNPPTLSAWGSPRAHHEKPETTKPTAQNHVFSFIEFSFMLLKAGKEILLLTPLPELRERRFMLQSMIRVQFTSFLLVVY